VGLDGKLSLSLHFNHTWLSVLRLFQEYGADDRVNFIMGEKKYSVSDVYSLMGVPKPHRGSSRKWWKWRAGKR
jgi:hypothetical protein